MSKEDRQKSWREIDRGRDRAGGGQKPPPRPAREEDRQQKQYRAALEALFSSGGIGKLADKLENSSGFPRTLTPEAVVASASEGEDGPEPQTQEKQPERASESKGADRPRLSSDSQGASSEATQGAQGTNPSASNAPAASTGKPGASSKKKPDDRLSLRRKVVEGVSRHEITKAVEKYLERFPMPDDHEFLEQILEHENDTRISEAIMRIGQLLDRRQPPKRSRAMVGKLRYIMETSSNEELRQSATQLLSRLG